MRAEQELASAREELRELSAKHDVANAEAVRLGGANAELTDQLRTARDEGAVSRANAEAAKVELAKIRTRLDEAERNFREKEALFREASGNL